MLERREFFFRLQVEQITRFFKGCVTLGYSCEWSEIHVQFEDPIGRPGISRFRDFLLSSTFLHFYFASLV